MDFWLIAVLANGIVLAYAVFYAVGHGALARVKVRIAFIRLDQIHVSRYLFAGDAAMAQHPIPYPVVQKLRGFLDEPLIRRTLPQGLMHRLDCAPQ